MIGNGLAQRQVPTATIIGPLPADLTHSASCDTPWIVDTTGFFLYGSVCGALPGAQTTTLTNSACYPYPLPGDIYDTPVLFTPAGKYPQGLTSACNVTKNVHDSDKKSTNPAANATPAIYNAIGYGDTAIGCCPTGYECGDIQLCVSAATEGQVIIGISYGLNCSSQPSLYTFQSAVWPDPIVGPAIQSNIWIIQHSQDSDTSTVSSGLSTGAKIGLILGLCFRGIAVGITYFIWWHRRRKLRRRETTGYRNTSADIPPDMQKPELLGSHPEAGGGVNGPVAPREELDVESESKPPELNRDGNDAASRRRLELRRPLRTLLSYRVMRIDMSSTLPTRQD